MGFFIGMGEIQGNAALIIQLLLDVDGSIVLVLAGIPEFLCIAGVVILVFGVTALLVA